MRFTSTRNRREVAGAPNRFESGPGMPDLRMVVSRMCQSRGVCTASACNAVARNSYHVKGMAVDIMMKSRSVRDISRAGLSLRAGGVGRYSHSGFVHFDSGPVRRWGT
jgi:uncharacterized protein YcbK (DUF882 family)